VPVGLRERLVRRLQLLLELPRLRWALVLQRALAPRLELWRWLRARTPLRLVPSLQGL
jgi:hypothetical protein